jgi:hypothetical protein
VMGFKSPQDDCRNLGMIFETSLSSASVTTTWIRYVVRNVNRIDVISVVPFFSVKPV